MYSGLKFVSAKSSFLNVFSAICPSGDMSFGSNIFGPYVYSVICLSAICPFGQMSFGHMSFRSYVFRPYVRSATCLSAICLSTAYLHPEFCNISISNYHFSGDSTKVQIFTLRSISGNVYTLKQLGIKWQNDQKHKQLC